MFANGEEPGRQTDSNPAREDCSRPTDRLDGCASAALVTAFPRRAAGSTPIPAVFIVQRSLIRGRRFLHRTSHASDARRQCHPVLVSVARTHPLATRVASPPPVSANQPRPRRRPFRTTTPPTTLPLPASAPSRCAQPDSGGRIHSAQTVTENRGRKKWGDAFGGGRTGFCRSRPKGVARPPGQSPPRVLIPPMPPRCRTSLVALRRGRRERGPRRREGGRATPNT